MANQERLGEAAAQVLKTRLQGFQPEILVVLGSGLARAAQSLQPRCTVSFDELPGFAAATVPGHAGRILAGEWAGRRALALLGRMHLYEGHPRPQVTIPIAVAAMLGVRACVLTNMSGGLAADRRPPTLVVIDDHLDVQQGLPERPRDDRPAYYSPRLRRLLHSAGEKAVVSLQHGVYAGMLGPNYETPAEIRALRTLGAAVVGMSTVAEAEAAYRLQMECCGVSCIANFATGVTEQPIDHADVLAAAAALVSPLGRLLDALLPMV